MRFDTKITTELQTNEMYLIPDPPETASTITEQQNKSHFPI